MSGLRESPDGFGASVDTARPPRLRVLSLVPVLRQRIYQQMRADGTLFLIPHPHTRLPNPGCVVRWDLQPHYAPQDLG